jgi:hypothetical protein
VKFKDGDDLVLLVNNQGGMSALEMGAVVDETLTQLGMSPPFTLLPYAIQSSHRLPALFVHRSNPPPPCPSLGYRSRLTSRNPKHNPPQNPKRPIHGLNEHARNLPHPPQLIKRFRRM